MEPIAFVGIVLTFIAGMVGLSLGLSLLIDWWDDWRDAARRAQAELSYQASLRAWQLRQEEFDQEQRIRQATRRAMEQMLQVSRQNQQSGLPDDSDGQ